MKKMVAISLGGVALAGLAVAAVFLLSKQTTPMQTHPQHATHAKTPSPLKAPASSEISEAGQGRFTDYEPTRLQEGTYTQNVLLFSASWCPECRAYQKAITADTIPENTQILTVDYDNATDLKQRYGVTLQSTFVAVDKNGNLLKKWVGYGKEKSLATVLTALYGT